MVLKITKTPECYVGGAFIRSESGRVVPLTNSSGEFLCNIPILHQEGSPQRRGSRRQSWLRLGET